MHSTGVACHAVIPTLTIREIQVKMRRSVGKVCFVAGVSKLPPQGRKGSMQADFEWQVGAGMGPRAVWHIERGICESLGIPVLGCHGAPNAVAAGSFCLGQRQDTVNKVIGSVSLLLGTASPSSC